MKIDIETNIDYSDLTIDSCSELIDMLKLAYKTIRSQLYGQFLNGRHLRNTLIAAIMALVCYFLSDEIIFVYASPFIMLIIFLGSIIMAEYLTSKTKKVILEELEKVELKKEELLKQQQ